MTESDRDRRQDGTDHRDFDEDAPASAERTHRSVDDLTPASTRQKQAVIGRCYANGHSIRLSPIRSQGQRLPCRPAATLRVSDKRAQPAARPPTSTAPPPAASRSNRPKPAARSKARAAQDRIADRDWRESLPAPGCTEPLDLQASIPPSPARSDRPAKGRSRSEDAGRAAPATAVWRGRLRCPGFGRSDMRGSHPKLVENPGRIIPSYSVCLIRRN